MIKLYIEDIIIPSGLTYEHNATSWQVSRDGKFDDPSNLILNVTEDSVNLLEYDLDYNLANSETISVRVKYFFNNNTETEWSHVLKITKGDRVVSTEIQYIFTPRLTYELANDDDFDLLVNGTDVSIIYGSMVHESTSWEILDTSGMVLWSRLRDVDNLTSIRITKTMFDLNSYKDAIIVKCVYHSDTDRESYPGKVIIITSKVDNFILLPYIEKLFLTGDNIIDPLFSFAHDDKYDWRVEDINGNVIKEELDINYNVDISIPGDLLVNEKDYVITILIKNDDNKLLRKLFKLEAVPRTMDMVNVNTTQTPVIRDKNLNNITSLTRCVTNEISKFMIPVIHKEYKRLRFFRKSGNDMKLSTFSPNLFLGDDLDVDFITNFTSPYQDYVLCTIKLDDKVYLKVYRFKKNKSIIYEASSFHLDEYDTTIFGSDHLSHTSIGEDEVLFTKNNGNGIKIFTINMFTGIKTVLVNETTEDMSGVPTVSYVDKKKVIILGSYNGINKAFLFDLMTNDVSLLNIDSNITNDLLTELRITRVNNNEMIVIGKRGNDELVETIINIDNNLWEFTGIKSTGSDYITMTDLNNRTIVYK